MAPTAELEVELIEQELTQTSKKSIEEQRNTSTAPNVECHFDTHGDGHNDGV